MSEQEPRATRGTAILFFSLLAGLATGLTIHGLGYRASLALGLSIFAYLIATFVMAQLIQ